MVSLCKYQDGTISEMFKVCSLAMDGKLSIMHPRSMTMILLCLMQGCTKERPDRHRSLFGLVFKFLKERDIPLTSDLE